MKAPIFITGTDTGVGKTLVSALLLSAARASGRSSQYWKPIQTGYDSDTHTVSTLNDVQSAPKPLYEFHEPMAPLRAAEINKAEISVAKIAQTWKGFNTSQHWIIEGAGGLLVPIARPDVTMRTLCGALGASLVVVAQARLGAMNHTLLTFEAARNAGLQISALVWTGSEDPGLEPFFDAWEEMPESLMQLRVPTIEGRIDSARITALSQEIFNETALRRIFDAKPQ